MHRVVRTISGNQYVYLEESYRVPGVKTPRKRSIYLGPLNGKRRRKKGFLAKVASGVNTLLESNKKTADDFAVEAMEKQQLASDLYQDLLKDMNRDFYKSMGMPEPVRDPVPIEKEAPPLLHQSASVPPPDNLPTKESSEPPEKSPADNAGEAKESDVQDGGQGEAGQSK